MEAEVSFWDWVLVAVVFIIAFIMFISLFTGTDGHRPTEYELFGDIDEYEKKMMGKDYEEYRRQYKAQKEYLEEKRENNGSK